MLVEDLVLVELKSVESLSPIHTAQMLTYVKLSRRPVGFIINFNVSVLKDGIRRVVNPQLQKDALLDSPEGTVPSTDAL
jgi:GxxExxY protein